MMHSLTLPAFMAVVFCSTVAIVTAEPDFAWVQITDKAHWQARDSQGELVYKDKLWIFGGWFDSYSAPPRDVWCSPDGKKWTEVTKAAPWKHSDLPMSIVFQNRMWILGGWYNGRLPGHSASNAVWSSQNGKNWKKETRSADWSPRLAAAVVVHQDKLWMLGGTEDYYFGDDNSLKNDVWSTSEGKKWAEVTKAAPWAPRAYHQAVVLNDQMYVFGGGNYVPNYKAYNDVWRSKDGVNWTRLTEAAPWPPRIWFSAVTYRGRIWVIGGASKNKAGNWQNHGDVWHSADGKQWEQLKTKTNWKERHEHSAFVFQDKIFIAGGHAKPLNSEVWSLSLPEDFGK